MNSENEDQLHVAPVQHKEGQVAPSVDSLGLQIQVGPKYAPLDPSLGFVLLSGPEFMLSLMSGSWLVLIQHISLGSCPTTKHP